MKNGLRVLEEIEIDVPHMQEFSFNDGTCLIINYSRSMDERKYKILRDDELELEMNEFRGGCRKARSSASITIYIQIEKRQS